MSLRGSCDDATRVGRAGWSSTSSPAWSGLCSMGECVALGAGQPREDLGVGDAVYRLIAALEVVTNKARIVAGIKTLHHLLPDLVPPMDRQWTGLFFGWSQVAPEYTDDEDRPLRLTTVLQVPRGAIEDDGLATLELPAVDRAAATVVRGAPDQFHDAFRAIHESSGPATGRRPSIGSSTSTVTDPAIRG